MSSGEEKNYAKYLAKGSAITFGALLTSALLGLALRMYLTRSLSVENYGTLFAVIALFGLLTPFQNLGISSAIAKYLPEFKEKEEFGLLKSLITNALAIEALVSLSIASALWFLSHEISIVYIGSEAATTIIKVLSIWFITRGLLRIGESVFQGFKDIENSRSLEVVRLAGTFSFLILGSLVTNLSIELVAFSYLLGSIIAIFWALFRSRRYKKFIVSEGSLISKSMMKKLLIFGLPLLLTGIASSVMTRIDTMLVALFRSSREVGLYEVAYPISRYLSRLGLVIPVSLLPMVSELIARDDRKTLRSTFSFLTKITFVSIVPLTVLFIGFPEVIIRVLFGPEYVGAAIALQILAIAMGLNAISGIFQTALMGAERTDLIAKITGGVAGLNFLGNLILIPFWGIEGAAVSTLLSYLIIFSTRTHYASKIVKFQLPYISMLKSLTGSFMVLLIVLILKEALGLSLWPKVFFIVLISFFSYLGWIISTKTLERKDFERLIELLPIPKWLENILLKLSRG